jgi:hypothetical protein
MTDLLQTHSPHHIALIRKYLFGLKAHKVDKNKNKMQINYPIELTGLI